MAGATVGVGLDVLQDDAMRLVCPVCLELLNDPIVLPCSHSLCRDCLVSRRANDMVACPACRVVFEASDQQLEPNTVCAQVLSGLRAMDGTRSVNCERCDDAQAAFSCEQCNLLFCQHCSELLHKGKMRTHTVRQLDLSAQRVLPHCRERGHQDSRLDVFCTTCSVFICVNCRSKHEGHEIVSARRASDTAMLELQTWMPISTDQKQKLRTLTRCIDRSIDDVEKRAEGELLNLHQMLATLMEKLEQQAKRVADAIIERKITEVTRLCYARKEVLDVVARLNDEMARVQRVTAQSDPIEMIRTKIEILKKPAVFPIVDLHFVTPIVVQPLTIFLPQYTLPVVGPKMALGECFEVQFTTTDEQCVEAPDLEQTMYNCWTLVPMDNGQVLVNSIGLEWRLDRFEKGDFITLSNNGLTATTDCDDCYEQSSVLGNTPMESGSWYWKVRVLNLVDNKRVCFGVVTKPFDQIRSNPYKRMWGWASNGSALPGYERQSDKAKLVSGDCVWLKLDCDRGLIQAHWPHSGLNDVIEIGERARNKPLFPVFTLGFRGNTVEVEPVPMWQLAITA